MTRPLQSARHLATLALSALLAVPVFAQHRANWQAQNRPPKADRPSQEQKQQRQQQRQQKQQQNEAQRNANRPPQSRANADHPPQPDVERSNAPRPNPNRPPSAYAPPARNFNNLNPQQKQRALNNYKDYQNLSPAERQQVQRAYSNWQRLTPEQQGHIKNDVMPKWRQLPPDRQRAITSRLQVLQNMPEAARNQHLADPNFTRGMSEDDKAMLHELSHLHVGGAPEAPNE